MSKKFYYIDDDGKKHGYAGKVINDYMTGETYGLLAIQENDDVTVDLKFHEAIPAEQGYSSYYTYINNEGNQVKYSGLINNIKRNPIDNSYFFTYTSVDTIDLKHYPEIKPVKPYFTYINDNGEEVIYDGKMFYDKFTSSYYFYK